MQKNANPLIAWMDGAFTIQVVNATAGAGDVQSNPPAGSGGYRLKDDSSARAKLIAQYTSFQHHKNGFCKTEAGWTQTPPPDTDGGKASTPAPGSDDPKGDFASTLPGGGSSGGGGGGAGKYYYGGVEVLVTLSFDSSGVRQILTNLGGTVVSNTSSNFGSPQAAPLQLGQRARLGRLGWKEIIRE